MKIFEKTLANAALTDGLNTVHRKSYELISVPQEPASIIVIAKAVRKLLGQGFTVMAVRFGHSPAITVKPTMETRQLQSVCTGQSRGIDGRLYLTYAAGFGGGKVVWYKLKRPEVAH